MKNLLYLLLLMTNVVGAQGLLDQKVDFEARNSTLNEALLELSEKLDIGIAFSSNLLGKNTRQDFTFRQETLSYILDQMLSKKAINYRLLGDKIVLYKRPSYSISGFIADKESGERLIGATVYCPELQKGTSTNEYGFYSIRLPKGQHQLVFSYIGYEPYHKEIDLQKSIQEEALLSNALTLEPVIVTPGEQSESIFSEKKIGDPTQVMPAMVELSPQLGGVEDPIRAAQLIPGIQSGPDGIEGPIVRGASSGHNLMLLDGAPIYIPYHQLGLFSVYNQAAVRSTRIYKGSFPARYGGRLASVFDVRTKEGNIYQWSGQASMNLLNVNLMIEGPLKKERGGIMLASRLSYSNFLLQPFIKKTFFQSNAEDIQTDFSDLNAKLHYKIGEKDKLYLSFYRGTDNVYGTNDLIEFDEDIEENFKEEEEISLSWANNLFSLRWNHLFNNELFANTTLTYSQFNYEYSQLEEFTDEEGEELFELFFNDVRSFNSDIALNTDFDFIPTRNHHFRFGAGVSFREFIPQLTYFEEEDLDLDDLEEININTLESFLDQEVFEAMESHAYFEDRYSPSPNLKIEMGLRASSFITSDQSFFRLEPRIFGQYQLLSDLAIHASFSRMVQYLHLVSFSAIRLPNDLWIPSGSEMEPGESWQGELGIAYETLPNTVLSLDAYYKIMDNLYTYPDGFEIALDDLIGNLTPGYGTAAGLELALRHNGPNWGGIISYAYTQTERQFDEVNNGLPFVHAYDQPHQLKAFLYAKPSSQFQVALNWVYNAASPDLIIAPLGSDTEILGSVDQNGKRHQTRLNDYHRLDLNLSYELESKALNHRFQLGAYNLYDRANRTFTRLDYNDQEELSTRPVFGIGFRPSFSYRISF